jgi:hypothetical protein
MELKPCRRCGGSGEIVVRGLSHNPNCGFPTPDPQCDREYECPDCKGDGSQIRADLELIADLAATPGEHAE